MTPATFQHYAAPLQAAAAATILLLAWLILKYFAPTSLRLLRRSTFAALLTSLIYAAITLAITKSPLATTLLTPKPKRIPPGHVSIFVIPTFHELPVHNLPKYHAGLSDLFTQGLSHLMTFPTTAPIFSSAGWSSDPDGISLDKLTLNISDATLADQYNVPKSAQIPFPDSDHRFLTVGKFNLIANPVTYDDAHVHATLSATDVTMAVESSRHKASDAEQSLLTLNDAQNGKISLQMTRDDLKAILLKNMRQAAKNITYVPLKIDDCQINLTPVSDTSFNVDLQVQAHSSFLPVDLAATALITLDNQLNGQISNLKITSSLSLVDGILDSFASTIENKPLPLKSFFAAELVVKNVKINLANDQIAITADWDVEPVKIPPATNP